jgi:hypothetical protein
LQHHAERLCGRRTGIVHGGGRRPVEKDDCAPRRATRVGEVADADPADVGERSGGLGERRLRSGERRRGGEGADEVAARNRRLVYG